MTLAVVPDGMPATALGERFSQVTRSAWDSSDFERLFQEGSGRGGGLDVAASGGEAESSALPPAAASADSPDPVAQRPAEATAPANANRAAASGRDGAAAAPRSSWRSGADLGQAAGPPVLSSGGTDGLYPAAPEPETAAGPAGRLPAPAAEWAARVVTVAESGQGTEVYLRDSGLSASAAVELASSLCQILKDQGVQLNRLVVNGRRPSLSCDEAGSPESIHS